MEAYEAVDDWDSCYMQKALLKFCFWYLHQLFWAVGVGVLNLVSRVLKQQL